MLNMQIYIIFSINILMSLNILLKHHTAPPFLQHHIFNHFASYSSAYKALTRFSFLKGPSFITCGIFCDSLPLSSHFCLSFMEILSSAYPLNAGVLQEFILHFLSLLWMIP